MSRPVRLFIEPFAGSASVSIALLEAGYTELIAISDADPLVGNFWRVVFGGDGPYNEFRAWVSSAPITLDQFHEVQALAPCTSVEAAFKCLFLNRTSFSGILHRRAGPIGGQSQSSAYKIDCRFPRQRLLRRLDELHRLRDHVVYAGARSYTKVANCAGVHRLLCADPHRVVWYFDPPFFRKAEKLYNYTFGPSDHRSFRDFVHDRLIGHWIVSYDDAPEARELWAKHRGRTVASLTYSASAAARAGARLHKRSAARELIMSSFFDAPAAEVINLQGRHDRRPRSAEVSRAGKEKSGT
jgi:DNA adenine methylase